MRQDFKILNRQKVYKLNIINVFKNIYSLDQRYDFSKNKIIVFGKVEIKNYGESFENKDWEGYQR